MIDGTRVWNRRYAMVNPTTVSILANVPVASLDRFLQLVPKSQCGMLSRIKWEAKDKDEARTGSAIFEAIAPATSV